MNASTVKAALAELKAAEMAESEARLTEFNVYNKTGEIDRGLTQCVSDADRRTTNARKRLEEAIADLPDENSLEGRLHRHEQLKARIKAKAA